jgi:YggT family protein
MTILATAGGQIANFIDALVWVYSIIIIAYIFTSMFFTVGGRIPYSRWSRALLDFLRDVSEPYLSIFRRFIPPIGPLDLSPMVAIIVLVILGNIVSGVIRNA